MDPQSPLRTTITSGLVDQLRDEIRSGRVPPGSRLRQVEVANRFSVSTTPVREAFAILEREGLLISSPHRGMIVFQPTIADLTETYEIRIPLEALATRLAVDRMTPERLGSLEDILAEMTQAGGDPERYARLNGAFHATIYGAAERPKLQRLIAGLREESTAYLRLWDDISWTAADTQAEHEAIFDACLRQASQDASELMILHLQHTVDYVTTELTGRAVTSRTGAPRAGLRNARLKRPGS